MARRNPRRGNAPEESVATAAAIDDGAPLMARSAGPSSGMNNRRVVLEGRPGGRMAEVWGIWCR